jgi:hypothetical protein
MFLNLGVAGSSPVGRPISPGKTAIFSESPSDMDTRLRHAQDKRLAGESPVDTKILRVGSHDGVLAKQL